MKLPTSLQLALLFSLVLGLLTACGQKGPLFLPGKPAPTSVPTPPAVPTSPAPLINPGLPASAPQTSPATSTTPAS